MYYLLLNIVTVQLVRTSQMMEHMKESDHWSEIANLWPKKYPFSQKRESHSCLQNDPFFRVFKDKYAIFCIVFALTILLKILI